MSLQSNISDFNRTVEDSVSNALNYARNAFAQIHGSIETRLSTLWSGGFVGISEDGLHVLENALDAYINRIQGIINGFNPDGDITVALKGAPETAAKEFIESIKSLLEAYVSTMRAEKQEIWEAFNNFQSAGQNIAQQVSQDAEQIRSNAENIRID